MEINNSTVYTKERLLRFNRFYAKNQIFLWCALPISTVLVYFIGLIQAIFSELSLPVAACAFVLTLFDIILPLMFFVILPKYVLKKTKILNTVIEYKFTDGEIFISVNNESIEEKTSMKYSMLQKAAKNSDELYLFLSSSNAFVVDLSLISDEEKEQLKSALKANIKKVRWK
jgi:hypothetical protein